MVFVLNQNAQYLEEPLLPPSNFQFGTCYDKSVSFSSNSEQFEFIRNIATNCLNEIASGDAIEAVLQGFFSVVGQNISQPKWQINLPFDENARYELSIAFNKCAAKEKHFDAAGNILDQLAIFVFPGNYASSLNFAYRMESGGFYSVAKSIYKSCYEISHHPGCQIHSAMVSPYFVSSPLHAQYVFLQILRSFYHLLSPHSSHYLPCTYEVSTSHDYIWLLLREVPLISQTLGYSPGRIFNLLSMAIIQHYPPLLTLHNFSQLATPQDLPSSLLYMNLSLSDDGEAITESPYALLPPVLMDPRTALQMRLQRQKDNQEQLRLQDQEDRPEYTENQFNDSDDLSPRTSSLTVDSKRLRIGILSERFGNTSPGLCMQSIFQYLSIHYSLTMSFVFFDRGTMPTVFAGAMRDIATVTVNINEESVSEAAKIIAAQDLDVLIYLALPTNKLCFALAHTRLASVQILAGIGHPLTSGVAAGMDYVILPADMLPQEYFFTTRDATSASNTKGNKHLLHQQFSRLDTKFLTSRGQVDSISCAFQAFLCAESDEELTNMYLQYEAALADVTIVKDDASLLAREAHLLVRDQCGLSPECFSAKDSSSFYTEQIVVFSSMTHMMLDPIIFHRPKDDLVLAQLRSINSTLSLDEYYDSLKGMLVEDNQKAAPDPTAETQTEYTDSQSRPFKSERRSANVYRALRRLALHRPVLPVSVVEIAPDYIQSHFLSCSQLQEIVRSILHLHEVHPAYFQDAYEFGCYQMVHAEDGDAIRSVTLIPPRYHFYYAVQFARKLQVEMDEVMLHILQRDTHAVLIVKSEYRVVLPRMARLYQRLYALTDPAETMSREDIVKMLEARFAFVPNRISHEAYLGLIALSRVFLNTMPMGAGMTSAESIAMCTPILTLPSEMNVLHFADAQLKQIWTLTLDDMTRMVAMNRTDYVDKALSFGVNEDYVQNIGLRDRLCAGRRRLFAKDNGRQGRNKSKKAEGATTLPSHLHSEDMEEREGLHQVERVFSDQHNRNTVDEVANEWAQFLHRVTAI
jgi:hypothetical protein